MARPAKQGRRQRRWLSVFNNSAVQTMFIVVSAEVIFRVLSVRSPMGEPWFLDIVSSFSGKMNGQGSLRCMRKQGNLQEGRQLCRGSEEEIPSRSVSQSG